MAVEKKFEQCGPELNVREPSEVMKLERMGSFHPSRLSFARILIRKMIQHKTKINCSRWEIDEKGFGNAVYQLSLFGKELALVAFSNHIDPSQRTDRVIASSWDTSFALFDGVPSISDIKRLETQLPLQEAGRYNATELVLSRANKSVRMFELVAQSLSEGKQPSHKLINDIGYLMRTTAVYGNGKFGIDDRKNHCELSDFSVPFQLEMLTVYLIRNFSLDLVNHVAKARNPKKFVRLSEKIQRHLGIGNATGLGMAPFLVKHPVLLNNWFQVRETALSRMLDVRSLSEEKAKKLVELIVRVKNFVNSWDTSDNRQKQRIEILKREWKSFSKKIDLNFVIKNNALKDIFKISAEYSTECQELIVSLLLEVGGDLIDGLDLCLESTKLPMLYPKMRVHELVDLIKRNFSWALKINFSLKENEARFWYVSEEKLEPRLGSRFEEEGHELERPLDIARRVCSLNSDLEIVDKDMIIAEFLMKYPDHRFVIRRIQTNAWAPYSEIQDNLIDESCKPIDMLRCKLSFFGASKFDPKSDRWVRVNLFQGAPLKSELDDPKNDDWWMPVLNCS